MSKRFALLLDTGTILPLVRIVLKASARDKLRDWNAARDAAIWAAEQSASLPPDERPIPIIRRRAIGLVTQQPRKEGK